MVERYNVDVEKNENGYWEGVLFVSANGDYVRYSDYADALRQIAELRAQIAKATDPAYLTEALEKLGYGDIIERLQAAEAENARLRALPLKDEAERVLERASATVKRYRRAGLGDDVFHSDLCETDAAIDALLHRLRAGEQEGWRELPLPDPTSHASTSPGPVNCSIRKRYQGEIYPRTCERCRLGPCPFFHNDGEAKRLPAAPKQGEAK